MLQRQLLEVLLGGEAPGVVARIHQALAGQDVELSRLPDFERHGSAPAGLDPSLHTEGFGPIASAGAVADDDCHAK